MVMDTCSKNLKNKLENDKHHSGEQRPLEKARWAWGAADRGIHLLLP